MFVFLCSLCVSVMLGAGQLAPIFGTLGVSWSPGKQASIALRGRAFALEAWPGSLIAL